MEGLRPVADADSAALIALITSVFDEYPGCVMDVDGEEPALKAPATSFQHFWVVERAEGIVACVGCALGPPDGPSELKKPAELKKLYVHKSARRQGLGRALIELVERTAMSAGRRRIHLWSDTRFEAAHAVYEKIGYVRLPETRDLHDKSNTSEFHYLKELSPA